MLLLLACDAPPLPDATVVTWDAPVALEADFTVPAGTTLVIEPGVTVTAAAGARLVVRGELRARGTAEAPITFTGDPAAPWGGILFEAGALDARFERVDDWVEGSIVEEAIVENATRGMHLAGASPYVHAVTFRANEIPVTIDTVGGAGLLVSDGATPRIRDCRFEGNIANTFAFGGAIYVDGADPIIQDSVFYGNAASYGGGISTNLMAAPIVGSTFEANDSQSEGGAISLVSSVSALLADTITRNHAVTDGAGLHVCVTCDPHAAPTLLDLVVTDNTSDAGDPDEGAAGIGAAFLGAFSSNDVHGNLRVGEPSDFGWFNLDADGYPDWIAGPALTDVWWGTDDLDAIEATVWDGADDARYGVVQLGAVRSAPIGAPTPRVVIASRRQVYEDAGDAVPVFLTLYNPGPELRATLTLTRDGAPFAGDLDYPDAARDGDAWRLVLPENSAWFATIEEGSYDGVSAGDVTWEATLLDADGAVVGLPSTARTLFVP